MSKKYTIEESAGRYNWKTDAVTYNEHSFYSVMKNVNNIGISESLQLAKFPHTPKGLKQAKAYLKEVTNEKI